MSALDDEQVLVVEKVLQRRERINKHLDKIQESYIKELNFSSDIKRTLISKFIASLDEQKENIQKDLDLLAHIKRHGSNLQTYIGILQIQERVLSGTASLEEKLKSEACLNHQISSSTDNSLEMFKEQTKQFGTIKMIVSLLQFAFIEREKMKPKS